MLYLGKEKPTIKIYYFDAIEINTVYEWDDTAKKPKEVLCQVGGLSLINKGYKLETKWEWWRIYKKDKMKIYPGKFVFTEENTIKIIFYKNFYYSHTFEDLEVLNREEWPTEKRKGLE